MATICPLEAPPRDNTDDGGLASEADTSEGGGVIGSIGDVGVQVAMCLPPADMSEDERNRSTGLCVLEADAAERVRRLSLKLHRVDPKEALGGSAPVRMRVAAVCEDGSVDVQHIAQMVESHWSLLPVIHSLRTGGQQRKLTNGVTTKRELEDGNHDVQGRAKRRKG